MAELPEWASVRIGDCIIEGQVPISIGLRVYLKVGPIEAEIGMVDGNDPIQVERLLRETADQLKRVRLGRPT